VVVCPLCLEVSGQIADTRCMILRNHSGVTADAARETAGHNRGTHGLEGR
jgi:hypothetical protein